MEAPKRCARLEEQQSRCGFVQGIPGCCADVREAAQPYLGDKLDERRDGDILEAVLLRQCCSSAPGLCWDLRKLRGDKPVCTGLSVRDGTAEAGKKDSAVRAFPQPGVQTPNLLQASSWRWMFLHWAPCELLWTLASPKSHLQPWSQPKKRSNKLTMPLNTLLDCNHV